MPQFQQLILVRHGDYARTEDGSDMGITTEGEEQMRTFAAMVRHHICRESVDVLSSTALRSTESTQELMFECNINPGRAWYHPFLVANKPGDENLPRARELIKDHPHAGVIILVGHKEYVEGLALHYSEQLDQPSLDNDYTTDKGEGWLIDLRAGTVSRIPARDAA